MKNSILNLNANNIKISQDKLMEQGLEIMKDVFIPEADIFLCKYKNKRLNLKIDLDYGLSIESVDFMDNNEIKEIEKILKITCFKN